MKIQNNLLNLLLISSITLMLVACDSKTAQEENNTNPAPTIQTAEDTSVGGRDDVGTGGTDAESNDDAVDTVTANTADDSTATVGGNDNSTSTVVDDDTTTAGNTNSSTPVTGTTDANSTNPVDNNISTTPTTKLKSLTLNINKTSLNKEENTTVELKATYDDGTSKTLSQNITWIATPNKAVSITNNILTAKKDRAVTLQAKVGNVLSNTVNLNITWVVNGHTLPPEPDKVLNDSTLLGIDVNNNGVRDDVERWIYETYEHPIERGIFMQSSRAYGMVIVEPMRALETRKYISNVVGCKGYWRYFSKKNNEAYVLERYRDTSLEINKVQFNTLKRHMAYERFNGELSGGVYGSSGISKEKCEFDEQGILKALK